ncbi:MAG TPA: hypothetical protein VGE62_01115 [Candidatus Paceibacterota bacterium]
MNKIITSDSIGSMGEVRITKRNSLTKSGRKAYGRGRIISVTDWMKNRIVSGIGGYGRNILIRRLLSDNTYTGNITHADLGTGSTAAADSDTDLETGLARAQVGSSDIGNDSGTIRFFFADALTPDATYREFGTFIDGSVTLGTGRIFNRLILTTPYVKATGEDTTVEVRFTINPL